jgi:hypothetical protein
LSRCTLTTHDDDDDDDDDDDGIVPNSQTVSHPAPAG